MGNEINGTLAIGPCCDKNMARSCSSNPGHTTLDKTASRGTTRLAFCHPDAWLARSPSSEVPSGRQPSARSSHDGTSKPAVSNASAHLNNDWMEEQFSCLTREWTIVSATPGCLCLIIFNASAQLAQWAAGLDLVALRKLKPPSHRGSDAWIRASHEGDNPAKRPHRGLGQILPNRQDQLISRRNLNVLRRNRTAKATQTARLELLGFDQEGSGDSRSSVSRNC